MDLFSFERKIFLAIPPDETQNFSGQLEKGTLRDYQRVFDQENMRHVVVPMRGARLEFSALRITLEEYRKIVSGMIHSLDIADYSTYASVISHCAKKGRRERFLQKSHIIVQRLPSRNILKSVYRRTCQEQHGSILFREKDIPGHPAG